MGVSRRSYAAQRGVSEAAVRKAIATGRITTLADGIIDPARADAEWGTQTDPAKQRGQHARQMGSETAASTARAAATRPVPQATIKAVADTLRIAVSETPRVAANMAAELVVDTHRMAQVLDISVRAHLRGMAAIMIEFH